MQRCNQGLGLLRRPERFPNESSASLSDMVGTGACDIPSSPVVGKDGGAEASAGACANIGADSFSNKELVFIELCARSATLCSIA